MATAVKLKLVALPAVRSRRPEFAGAYGRLRGAHEAVQGLLDNLEYLRETKRLGGVKLARLKHPESDLLRAAILFAGAGIDAVLKALIEDCLHKILLANKAARTKRGAFISNLVKDEAGNAIRVLNSLDIEKALHRCYVETMTQRSLQGEKALKDVRDALGIEPTGRFSDQELESFRDFFEARNEIAHELDLKDPRGRGDSSRKDRAMSTTMKQCNGALQLSAAFIRATEELLYPTLYRE